MDNGTSVSLLAYANIFRITITLIVSEQVLARTHYEKQNMVGMGFGREIGEIIVVCYPIFKVKIAKFPTTLIGFIYTKAFHSFECLAFVYEHLCFCFIFLFISLVQCNWLYVNFFLFLPYSLGHVIIARWRKLNLNEWKKGHNQLFDRINFTASES